MTAELDAHSKDGPAFQRKVPLDKSMADWGIKDFHENYVGCDSWKDLDDKNKKACEWHKISCGSY